MKFRWFLTLSSKNYDIWLIFECAWAKTAWKSWDLLHRTYWITPQIYIWRTSPRMENLYLLLSFHSKNTYIFQKSWEFFSDQWPSFYQLRNCVLKYIWESLVLFRPLDHLHEYICHLLLSDLIAVLLNYLL